MNRTILLTYVMLIALAIPATVFAEGEAFNPPNWVGGGMFALALILPAAAYAWMRSR